jgi:alkaline phosphatase D
MSLHRRGFLSLCAGAAAASMLAGAGSSVLPARPASYPFRLGVASGAPVPDGMVLWTRLILDPLADTLPEALAAAPIAVRWEVADDEQFRHVAARGDMAKLLVVGDFPAHRNRRRARRGAGFAAAGPQRAC